MSKSIFWKDYEGKGYITQHLGKSIMPKFSAVPVKILDNGFLVQINQQDYP